MRNLQISKGQSVLTKSYNDPLFKAVFDDSPDAIFLLNCADFQIIECNNKAISLFQAQHKNDLIGFEIFNLYDAEPVEFSKNQFIDAVNNGLQYSHELAFRSIRGNVFWGRYDVKPIEVNGNKVIIFRVRRVVDYMKTAEMLSVLVKHTSMVTGVDFFNMVTALLSKTFDMHYCIMVRLSSPGSQNATTLSCWINGSLNDNFSFNLSGSASMNVLKGYTTFYPRNLREMFPADELANRYNAVSYMGAPVYNPDGQVIGLIIMMDDKPMEEIPNSRYVLSLLASRAGTELNRLDVLKNMQLKIEELEKSIQLKDKFIQLFFNDLTNPVNHVVSMTEVLKDNINNLNITTVGRSVKEIDTLLKNTSGLLNSMAEWSEIQQRQTIPFIHAFDVYEAVKETVDLYFYIAESKDIQLINYIYPGTLIHADKNIIKSVIRNVIASTLQYAKPGGQLIIDAMTLENHVNLTIQINGTLEAEKDISIFLNAESSSLRPGKHIVGEDIKGISICKEMLELNNALISFESREGESTTITITIPSGQQK